MMCVCDLELPPERGRLVRPQTATQVSEHSGLHRKDRTHEVGRPKPKRTHPDQAKHSQPPIANGEIDRQHRRGAAVIARLGPCRRNRLTTAQHARFHMRLRRSLGTREQAAPGRTGRTAPLDLRSPLRYARPKRCTLGCWIAKKP